MIDDDRLEERLTLGWQALSPPAELKARVRAQVVGGAGAERLAPAAQHGRTGSGSRWQALKESGALGLSAGSALLALGFAAGHWLRADAPRENPPQAALVSAASDAPLQPAAAELVDAASAQRSAAPVSSDASLTSRSRSGEPRTAPRGTRETPSARATRDEMRPPHASEADELRALERAERAVRARHPQLALALLLDLNQTRPESSLLEERRALELLASCQLSTPESSARGVAFAQRYPGSVYAERIATECAAQTKAGAADIDHGEGGLHAKP